MGWGQKKELGFKRLENVLLLAANARVHVLILGTSLAFFYLINQTLGGPLVRALRARAGILLHITTNSLPRVYSFVHDQLPPPQASCDFCTPFNFA